MPIYFTAIWIIQEVRIEGSKFSHNPIFRASVMCSWAKIQVKSQKRVQTLPDSPVKDTPFEQACSVVAQIQNNFPVWKNFLTHQMLKSIVFKRLKKDNHSLQNCKSGPCACMINTAAKVCHQMWIICETSVFMPRVCYTHLQWQRHSTLTSSRRARKPSAEDNDWSDNQLFHLDKVIQKVALTKWREQEECDESNYLECEGSMVSIIKPRPK